MRERRTQRRRLAADRRSGEERRRRGRRVAAKRPPGGRDRRVAERRCGIDRRILRGRVLHDRRRSLQGEWQAAPVDETDRSAPVVASRGPPDEPQVVPGEGLDPSIPSVASRGAPEEVRVAPGMDHPIPIVPRLEEDVGRVRPLIGFPPRGGRRSRIRMLRDRSRVIAVAALVIAALIVIGILVR